MASVGNLSKLQIFPTHGITIYDIDWSQKGVSWDLEKRSFIVDLDKIPPTDLSKGTISVLVKTRENEAWQTITLQIPSKHISRQVRRAFLQFDRSVTLSDPKDTYQKILSEKYQDLFSAYVRIVKHVNIQTKASPVPIVTNQPKQLSEFSKLYNKDVPERDFIFRILQSDDDSKEAANGLDPGEILVHSKVLLSWKGSYFEKICTSGIKEKIIEIQGVAKEIFLKLIQYLYTSQIKKVTNLEAYELFQLASRFDIPDLQELIRAQARMGALELAGPQNLTSPEVFDNLLDDSDLEEMDTLFRNARDRILFFKERYLEILRP